jgi:hypothetical protein
MYAKLNAFWQNRNRLLVGSLTACLSSSGFSRACKGTVYKEEREMGLEPTTACLEGRYLQHHRSLVFNRLEKPVYMIIQNGMLR